ncbi:hypothetical protein DERF_009902 [Dermatophagoides farinae]|uniref:Uncharacterized protein n=1 Tax=Dermatophagoides farinae TaxID=6954 RepID=A0A922HW19_DERFA|nr:hypothetical protein DERF_009902 [Dermatophagoides farinae]
MVIGGQIPGRTIEQNLTSEARDGFAMSWRSAFRAKPHERSSSANGQTKDLKNNTESNKRLISMDQKKT